MFIILLGIVHTHGLHQTTAVNIDVIIKERKAQYKNACANLKASERGQIKVMSRSLINQKQRQLVRI
jgi:hypothetical protein